MKPRLPEPGHHGKNNRLGIKRARPLFRRAELLVFSPSSHPLFTLVCHSFAFKAAMSLTEIAVVHTFHNRRIAMRRKQHPWRSVRQQPVFKPSCEELEHRLVLSASTLSFTPLPSSVALGSLPESAPFSLPSGFTQTVIQSRQGDPDVLDNLDMNTLNETGPDAGRYLFTASETGSNAGVVRHDLVTGDTVVISRRADYERFDGIRWTPWGTLLVAEETAPGITDPDRSEERRVGKEC